MCIGIKMCIIQRVRRTVCNATRLERVSVILDSVSRTILLLTTRPVRVSQSVSLTTSFSNDIIYYMLPFLFCRTFRPPVSYFHCSTLWQMFSFLFPTFYQSCFVAFVSINAVCGCNALPVITT